MSMYKCFQVGKVHTRQIVDVEKINILTILILFSCKLSFSIIILKIPSYTTFALKWANNILMQYFENWLMYALASHKSYLFQHHFQIQLWHEHSTTVISHQWSLSIMYKILVLTNCHHNNTRCCVQFICSAKTTDIPHTKCHMSYVQIQGLV
jgi:hypothetical protein